MKESVFIDTGYWIALFDGRDQNHYSAKKALRILLHDYEVYLSDFIIFETLTYLNCSLKRHDLAIKFIDKTESIGIHALRVDETTKINAVHWFKKYSDKDFSITDCTSFVLMKTNDIRFFAGFDDHFKQMSFIPIIPKIID